MVLIPLVQEVDTVYSEVEVRSRTELGFVEYAVLDNFGVSGEVGVEVDIRHVGGYLLSAYGEVVTVKHMESAGFELVDSGIDGSLCAGGGNSGVDSGENNGTFGNTAAPVNGYLFAVLDAVDDVLEVRSPVYSEDTM